MKIDAEALREELWVEDRDLEMVRMGIDEIRDFADVCHPQSLDTQPISTY